MDYSDEFNNILNIWYRGFHRDPDTFTLSQVFSNIRFYTTAHYCIAGNSGVPYNLYFMPFPSHPHLFTLHTFQQIWSRSPFKTSKKPGGFCVSAND